jgi:hypothetical protein
MKKRRIILTPRAESFHTETIRSLSIPFKLAFFPKNGFHFIGPRFSQPRPRAIRLKWI